MTPPDSGYAEPCEVTGCIRRNGHAPPHTTEIVDMDDSGEREVDVAQEALARAAHAAVKDTLDVLGSVLLPLPLAQRILAALEGSLRGTPTRYEDMEVIAAELRAIVERKT